MQAAEILKDLEYIEKDLEYIDGFTASMKKAFVNEATNAIKEQRPIVWMGHSEYEACRGVRQRAGICVYDPNDTPGFRGWIKYFVGNGGVIDPDITEKPTIPGAFQCMDKRFPEFTRTVHLVPGTRYQNFQLPYYVPVDIELGVYFGNVFLIQQGQPVSGFPEFVTGAYGEFEVLEECPSSVPPVPIR